MINQILEDEFSLKYYTFLEKIPSKIIEKEFYIPSKHLHKTSYYFLNRDNFNKTLLFLINSNFKRAVFKKDDFFVFLENELFGYPGIDILHKRLIHKIQFNVDLFMGSQYDYLIKREDFYKKYNPFNSTKEFHYFIIKSILKNIEFIPETTGFIIKKSDYVIEAYFRKVLPKLRDNFKVSGLKSDLHIEANRLKILKEKHDFIFLSHFINEIEVLIAELNSYYGSSKKEIKEINQDISNTYLTKKNLERIQTTLVINTLENIFNHFFKLNELVYNQIYEKEIKELIQISFGTIMESDVDKQIDISFIPKSFRKDFVRIFLFLLEKGKITTKKTLLIETLCQVIKTDGFSRRTLFKINSKQDQVKFENYNLRRIIGDEID